MTERGPIEDGEWADVLEAHVVEDGSPPRLHGYDVWNDLARNYSFSEIALLSLRGEVPTVAEGRAFDLALTLLAPASIAEAPAHTAALLRMMASPPANTVALGAITLTQQAQEIVDAHAGWLAWLSEPTNPPPPEFLASDRASAAAVRAAIDPGLCPALADIDATPEATALALLHASGLRGVHELVTALVLARLPVVVAEAVRHGAAGLRSYPIEMPPFDYEEDDRG